MLVFVLVGGCIVCTPASFNIAPPLTPPTNMPIGTPTNQPTNMPIGTLDQVKKYRTYVGVEHSKTTARAPINKALKANMTFVSDDQKS